MAEGKIRVLIDTCVVLDLALKRKGFVEQANEIFALANSDKICGYIATQSIPTTYYYIKKYNHNEQITRQIISVLANMCYILDTTAKDCLWALQAPTSDYEDAILAETATREHLDAIITRDKKGFKNSALPIFTPEEFLKKWR